jgi:hypothetical protein
MIEIILTELRVARDFTDAPEAYHSMIFQAVSLCFFNNAEASVHIMLLQDPYVPVI